MDDEFKTQLLMSQITKMFEQALELSGHQTLVDFSKQMEQMNFEQKVKFLERQMENPYTCLKKHILSLESEYEEFKKNPANTEKAYEQVAEMLGIEKEEVKAIAEGSKDDDDTTKH
jgi:endonuclease III